MQELIFLLPLSLPGTASWKPLQVGLAVPGTPGLDAPGPGAGVPSVVVEAPWGCMEMLLVPLCISGQGLAQTLPQAQHGG